MYKRQGSDSVYFNREGRYGEGGAYRRQDSPYYPWYTFRRWPDDYDCWWNFITLPNVNECNPDYDASVSYTHLDVYKRQGLKQEPGS